MKNRSTILIAWFGIILLFAACSNDEIEPNFDRLGYSYFPVEVGTWRTYQVDQSTFRVVGDTIVESFQLREEIVDSFLNAENDTTYILHRSKLDTASGLWVIDSVWSVRRTLSQAIVVENNVPFVKLGFPVTEDLTWNGNGLNILDEELYVIDSLGISRTLDVNQFPTTLKVVQSDIDDTIIRFDQRSEVYALGVGMIKKSKLVLNYCATVDCLGDGIVESGVVFDQELLDYGPK